MEKKILPPGQRAVKDLPVLHYSHIPELKTDEYRLIIRGHVEEEIELTFKEILELPKTEITAPFHCVTGWSNLAVKWGGTLAKNLFSKVRPRTEAKFVYITCYDGYSTNLPVEMLVEPDCILAYELEGEVLPPEHGFPLRLVVPQRYAYKSPKWLKSIEFLEKDKKGYWELRGYSNNADPYKEERYSP